MKVTAVVITSKRSGLREQCLRRLAAHREMEIVIVVNGPDRETGMLVDALAAENSRVVKVALETAVPKSAARNRGLERAGGDIVYFLDDDSWPAGNNMEILREKFRQHAGMDIIGGPNLTPPGSSLFQRCAGHALSSRFIAWRMKDRYAGTGRDERCDDRSLILCNLAFRRKIFFEDTVFFDDRLEYNEENLLLRQFSEKGRAMLHVPSLVVYHERRRTFPEFARQVFKSGEGRAIMTRLSPGTLAPVHVAPALFLLYAVSLAFVPAAWYGGPSALYLALAAANAAAAAVERKEPFGGFLLLFVMAPVAHLSYGAGFIVGLLRGVHKNASA